CDMSVKIPSNKLDSIPYVPFMTKPLGEAPSLCTMSAYIYSLTPRDS
ncbi:14263_t:CDS:1, partial [Entrophospora sp. SA101]